MVDTPGLIIVKDGETPVSESQNIGGTRDGNNTFYPVHSLRADGAAVGAATPLPVGDATGNAALGTPADTAWASGSGSLVALLKGVFGKLAGTLTTTLTGALPAGGNALGSVTVSNLPATQPVSGSVNVGNFPATQPVSLTALPALAAGANAIGGVSVSNFPASQPVQGTVAAGLPPALPPISVSGVDGSGNKQHLLTDTGGRAQVGVTNWPTTQPVSLASAIVSNTGGTVGHDYSANTPTLPVIGAGFAASGPYASYVLIATVPALVSRNEIEVQNVSGAQIAVLLDDGTAASSAAPVNASLFSLAAGSAVGAQGGSWSSTAFKGRVQVFAPVSTAFVEVSGR